MNKEDVEYVRIKLKNFKSEMDIMNALAQDGDTDRFIEYLENNINAMMKFRLRMGDKLGV
tara:strand:- start:410 stop:589 length:180 start_codon:yes stop_codon:yes gene_type:complete